MMCPSSPFAKAGSFVCLLLTLAFGCSGSDRPARYRVHGTVTFNGDASITTLATAAQDYSIVFDEDVTVTGANVSDCAIFRPNDGNVGVPADGTSATLNGVDLYTDATEETLTVTCNGFEGGTVSASHTVVLAGFTTELVGWNIDDANPSWTTRNADTTCEATQRKCRSYDCRQTNFI